MTGRISTALFFWRLDENRFPEPLAHLRFWDGSEVLRFQLSKRDFSDSTQLGFFARLAHFLHQSSNGTSSNQQTKTRSSEIILKNTFTIMRLPSSNKNGPILVSRSDVCESVGKAIGRLSSANSRPFRASEKRGYFSVRNSASAEADCSHSTEYGILPSVLRSEFRCS